jgi:GrpB-like predicted nucleotidyltransferase (UPF0157 family)
VKHYRSTGSQGSIPVDKHKSKIGLKRGVVKIVRHRKEWAELYDAEAEKLKNCLGETAVDIQHVGSTAVAGLISKPIIDIAIAVSSHEDLAAVVKRLTDIGYIDGGDQGASGGYLLVKESEPDVRTFHIHIVEKSDVQWRNYIIFRDCLRRNVKTRAEYARLKETLAEKFPADREAYTSGKAQFIRDVLNNI